MNKKNRFIMEKIMTPSQKIQEKAQLICWGCGVGFYVLFCLGMWPLMEFIPPPSPLLSGAEIVAKYQDNIVQVRTGIILSGIGAGLMIPWSIMMGFQVARMETGKIPFMSVLSVGAGMVTATLFILPFILWAGTFYRVDRSPELILLLNDLTWLEFVMFFPPYIIQMIAIAVAGLTSTAPRVVIPRWFCYLNLWVSLLTVPGVLAIYFYEGPFAWNGILAFWIPVSSFALYYLLAFPVFYKAIKSHKLDVT